MIAALFVEKGGAYFGLDGVELPSLRWGFDGGPQPMQWGSTGHTRPHWPKSQHVKTPPAFRDELLAMARSVYASAGCGSSGNGPPSVASNTTSGRGAAVRGPDSHSSRRARCNLYNATMSVQSANIASLPLQADHGESVPGERV